MTSKEQLQLDLADANTLVAAHAGLAFVTAWRSIGSHVFLEFGAPEIRPLRRRGGARSRMLQGQLSLELHGDDWELLIANRIVATSDFVTSEQVADLARSALRDATLKGFAREADALLIDLGDAMSVRVRRTPDLALEDDHDETRVRLPDRSYMRFDFDRGFTMEAPPAASPRATPPGGGSQG